MVLQGGNGVLSVKDLSIRLAGQSITDHVSFEVSAGQTLAIVGESGCGKSVTALALMGLLPHGAGNGATGRIEFEGLDLLALDQRAMADLRGNRLAMVFQEPMTALNPILRIGQQLNETIQRHQNLSDRDARDKAVEMLALVKVPDPEARLRSYPHELSGGMRQRVMIAMALANGPVLLIADEPTTALDVTIQAQVLNLIEDLQATTGTATILITHDLGVVAEMADVVAVMYAGQIVEMAPVQSLFDNPQHPYTLGLIGSAPSLGQRQTVLPTISGTVPPPADYSSACRFAPRCPFAQPDCRSTRPVLTLIAPEHSVSCLRAPLENDPALREMELA